VLMQKVPQADQQRRGATSTRSARFYFLKAFAVLGPLPPLLILLIVIFGVGNPVFLSGANLSSVSTQAVYLLLIALAQMMILITGGFDLSVGANVALTSVTSGLVMQAVYGGQEQYAFQAIVWGFVTAVLVGLAVGLVNGIGVAVLKVNPFIVTLATTSVVSGATMLVSGGSEVSGLPREFTVSIGSGRVLGGIPVPLLLALPVAVALFVALRWLKYGRSLFAIGGNATAAQVAGIRVKWHIVATYAIAGMITAYAGWLLTARVSSGQPQLGAEFVMESITAAIIGGASLRGGRGSVIGAVLGVAFIVALANGMNLLRLDANQQNVALGVALMFAVLISRVRDGVRTRVATLELQ
jgi:ribose/xylose/arabinose/galactoside ABC-type transport system permease subunit